MAMRLGAEHDDDELEGMSRVCVGALVFECMPELVFCCLRVCVRLSACMRIRARACAHVRVRPYIPDCLHECAFLITCLLVHVCVCLCG